MKVLWVVNCMLPEFSWALGRKETNAGGWMPSLVSAIRKFAPDVELHIVCEGAGDARAVVDGVHYYSFSRIMSLWLGSGRRKKRFGIKLKNLILEVQPNLIHLHGTENGYADFPDEVWGGVPRMISIQGVISGYHPHYMGNLTSAQLKPHRNWLRYLATHRMQTDVADIWRKVGAVREAVAMSRVRHLAGRTLWDKAWAKALSPEAEYHYVGEVLRPEFYPDCDRLRVVPHRIFASAAFKYPLKGGHFLLEAVAYLKCDYPDVKIVVSDSEQKLHPKSFMERLRATEYHNYLRHRIKDLGLESNVELCPSLTAAQVRDELEQAQVFCLPSLVENSPNSLGEAQLTHVPSVVTDVGGVSSMLEDGKTGLLVPSGDPAVLAFAIRQVFEDSQLAECLAANAREVAISRHSPETVVNDLMKCYRKTVSGGCP